MAQLSAQARTGAHVRLSAQSKLGAYFEQKENKDFCDQFW